MSANKVIFADRALGFSRGVGRNFPCQLPEEKFLTDFGGGTYASPDERIFER